MCGNAYKKGLATTIYFVGVLLGSLLFGSLSDKFGRRPVLLFSMYLPSIIGLLLFFIQGFIAFVILRFILGFFLQVRSCPAKPRCLASYHFSLIQLLSSSFVFIFICFHFIWFFVMLLEEIRMVTFLRVLCQA